MPPLPASGLSADTPRGHRRSRGRVIPAATAHLGDPVTLAVGLPKRGTAPHGVIVARDAGRPRWGK